MPRLSVVRRVHSGLIRGDNKDWKQAWKVDKGWTFCGAQRVEKFQDLSKESRLGELYYVFILIVLFLE